mgnify:CR=1 FL=1
MTRLPGHVKFALPLIFALCIIYASPVHAQSTLTDTRLQNGAAPLELPFFEDTTQTGSVQQAAVQFQRFGGSPDIFNVTKPLVVSGKGEMLWLHLDIANNSSTGSFVLSFAPQDKHGIAAVKAVRLFDPMQPNAPIAEWPSGADASSLPTLKHPRRSPSGHPARMLLRCQRCRFRCRTGWVWRVISRLKPGPD